MLTTTTDVNDTTTSVSVRNIEPVNSNIDPKPLPPFERDRASRQQCLVGLLVTILVSLGCIAFSLTSFIRGRCFCTHERPLIHSTATKEIASLVFNVCVTICTEILGFIHATSLRWALYHECRLRFNSNLRLFTSAKKCAANSWYINCIWAILITFSYSSASQVLQPMGQIGSSTYPNYSETAYALNAQALTILGISLLSQSILAAWCMVPSKSREILSWNSSAINTTLVLLHGGHIERSSGIPMLPQKRQPPARKASKAIRIIMISLWVLLPIILAWGLAMWFIEIMVNGKPNTSFNPQTTAGGIYPGTGHYTGNNRGLLTIMPLIIITAMQIVYTLALHMAEQVVNLTRDEAIWRRANGISADATGVQISPTGLMSILRSWQCVALLSLKPLSHWWFGLSAVGFSFGYIAFNPLPIFCLAGLSLVLASMVTVLALRRPKGPQPAAWGSVQRLADFIDDWGDGAGGRLYWGDKGLGSDPTCRLAGTSSQHRSVGEIDMSGKLYEGLGEVAPSGVD